MSGRTGSPVLHTSGKSVLCSYTIAICVHIRNVAIPASHLALGSQTPRSYVRAGFAFCVATPSIQFNKYAKLNRTYYFHTE